MLSPFLKLPGHLLVTIKFQLKGFGNNMTKRFPICDIESIRQAEQAVFSSYEFVLKAYAARYANFGVALNVGISWESHGETFTQQPPIDATYKSYVFCQGLDTNGAIVESSDHDFYMDFAWHLSAYEKGQIAVFTDIDDDLQALFQTCDDYFAEPY